MGLEDAMRGLVDLVDRKAYVFEGSSGENVVGAWDDLPALICLSWLRLHGAGLLLQDARRPSSSALMMEYQFNCPAHLFCPWGSASLTVA